jgi:hypothetical protein
VRRILLTAVAGLALALGLTDSRASDLKGAPVKPKPVVKPAAEGTCGEFGTSVYFEDTPKAAAKKARKEKKLVFVLHVSGLFEDPKLT